MDVNDLLVFTRVAQSGSFSRAAALLGMPVSTVSRRVAQLERQLGVPLLARTTRSLQVTEVGKAYLSHGQAIAAELDRADAYASSLQAIPQGLLRLTTTGDFGHHFLGPILRDFLKANPRVHVDITLTERVIDLVTEGYDLAIRVGDLESSTLIARRLGTLDLQLYASPAYLKTSGGEPASCAELARRDCVLFTGEGEPHRWSLRGPRGVITVDVRGRASTNDMTLVRQLALEGQGIALLPHFLCADDVKTGRLKILLKSWAFSPGPIHVVFPASRHLLPKVRAFVDHLSRCCAKVHWRS